MVTLHWDTCACTWLRYIHSPVLLGIGPSCGDHYDSYFCCCKIAVDRVCSAVLATILRVLLQGAGELRNYGERCYRNCLNKYIYKQINLPPNLPHPRYNMHLLGMAASTGMGKDRIGLPFCLPAGYSSHTGWVTWFLKTWWLTAECVKWISLVFKIMRMIYSIAFPGAFLWQLSLRVQSCIGRSVNATSLHQHCH